ncbi:MAG: hypothetical protein KDB53_00355 [Planctomycetes bacterium]|nr:hypothetical protein [Planctomycetota bacterium]
MNLRALQRMLFRMQLDPDFCRRVLNGESEEVQALGERERTFLRRVDPRKVGADRNHKRRDQALGNLLGEFALSFATLPTELASSGFPASFFSSESFHHCIRDDGRLPLALASHWEDLAARAGRRRHRAIVRLEAAMVRLRRRELEAVEVEPGCVALASSVALIDLPRGTLDFAGALRGAADEGKPPPDRTWSPDRRLEDVLLSRRPRGSWRLPEVDAEALSPAVAGLLRACAEEPRAAAYRADYARRLDAEPADIEEFVASLVSEGVLVA